MNLETTPWPQLDAWWAAAEAEPTIRYPNAAVLATVELAAGRAAADGRVVLIHQRGPDGFVISTDDASPKAQQLGRCASAALVVYWPALERQIRLRGTVETADEATADHCFRERPRASRITAWASRQGTGLIDRAMLDQAWERADRRFRDVDEVPRPEHWRAWRLRATAIEFWQAGARRLHDRHRWLLGAQGWTVERLWP